MRRDADPKSAEAEPQPSERLADPPKQVDEDLEIRFLSWDAPLVAG